MIVHVVLLKWNSSINSEALARVTSEFARLPEHIEQIQSYQFGADQQYYKGNADYALVARFESQSALDEYVRHPEHKRFLSEVAGPYLDSFMSAQFIEQ